MKELLIKKRKKKIWVNLYRRTNLATICIWFGWPRKESEGKKHENQFKKKNLMLKNKIEKNIIIKKIKEKKSESTIINSLTSRPWKHDWDDFIEKKIRRKKAQRPTLKKYWRMKLI